MTCGKCGSEVNDIELFCMNCGAEIIHSSVAALAMASSAAAETVDAATADSAVAAVSESTVGSTTPVTAATTEISAASSETAAAEPSASSVAVAAEPSVLPAATANVEPSTPPSSMTLPSTPPSVAASTPSTICKSCGNEINEETKFCRVCGTVANSKPTEPVISKPSKGNYKSPRTSKKEKTTRKKTNLKVFFITLGLVITMGVPLSILGVYNIIIFGAHSDIPAENTNDNGDDEIAYEKNNTDGDQANIATSEEEISEPVMTETPDVQTSDNHADLTAAIDISEESDEIYGNWIHKSNDSIIILVCQQDDSFILVDNYGPCTAGSFTVDSDGMIQMLSTDKTLLYANIYDNVLHVQINGTISAFIRIEVIEQDILGIWILENGIIEFMPSGVYNEGDIDDDFVFINNAQAGFYKYDNSSKILNLYSTENSGNNEYIFEIIGKYAIFYNVNDDNIPKIAEKYLGDINNMFIEDSTGNTDGVEDAFMIGNYVGRVYDEVFTELREAGIRAQENKVPNNFVENGVIMEQSIEMGRLFKRDGTDTIVFEVSDGAKSFTVPNYRGAGTDSRTAEAELRANSLVITVTDESNNEIPKGYVIRTEPGAGALLDAGDKIQIFRSLGADIVRTVVPSLIGKTYREAVEMIDEAKLILGYTIPESTIASAIVIRQSIAPNTAVDEGVVIDLWFNETIGESSSEPTTVKSEASSESTMVTNEVPSDDPFTDPTPVPDAEEYVDVSPSDPDAASDKDSDAPTSITISLRLPPDRNYGDTIKVLVEATPSDTGKTTRIINRSVMKNDFPKYVDIVVPLNGTVEIKVYFDSELMQTKVYPEVE